MKLKPFSRLWVLFLSVTIPSILLILFLHFSSLNTLLENHNSLLRSNQRMIITSVERTLDLTDDAVNKCISSMDFVTFSSSASLSRTVKYSGRLSSKLRSALGDNREVVGFTLYNAACDRLYYTNLSGQIHTADLEALTKAHVDGSFVTSHSVTALAYGDDVLIALTYTKHFGTLVVFLAPSSNAYYQSYNSNADENDIFHYLLLQEDNLPLTPISETFDDLPICLTVTKANTMFSFWRESKQVLMLILIVVLLVLALWIARAMQDWFILPLRRLSHAFDRIAQGDSSYRIKEKTYLREINDFYQGFNQTLDTLQNAVEEKNRSEITAIHARLQYFQLQIRPHFYLNCLKNIRAMASLKDTDKIQDMVFLMSEYLRYIFQDTRQFIPLYEELQAVQGYIDLCACMGNTLELKADIDTCGLNDQVLPMSILTFVENSIKHNKNPRKMTITVISRTEESEDEIFHTITVRDDGSGFPPEVLHSLNTADPTELTYRRDHIGIANVRYRLWMVYGDKADVSFANEGEEAVVTIRFPAQPKLQLSEVWDPESAASKGENSNEDSAC